MFIDKKYIIYYFINVIMYLNYIYITIGGSKLRRLIMLVFLLISLFAIIAYTMTIESLVSTLGGISIDFLNNAINKLISGLEFKEMMVLSAILLRVFFSIYGIPLIVFLISFNGLMQVRKKHLQ